MGQTTIEWTAYYLPNGKLVLGYTFNPWEGCTKIRPACANCYAWRRDKRLHKGQHWGPGSSRLMHKDAYWDQPIKKWNKEATEQGERRRVFCGSLCDWLEDLPELRAPRARLMATIYYTPNLDWLLLSKRVMDWRPLIEQACAAHHDHGDPEVADWLHDWLEGIPPHNVWMGATMEIQSSVDDLEPALLDIPAHLHFVSAEPLLGYIDIPGLFNEKGPKIDWVFTGGESGPGSRPTHPAWMRHLRDQTVAAKKPFLVKQWGEYLPYERYADPPFYQTPDGHLHDGHGLNILDPATGDAGKGWDPGFWCIEEELPDCAFLRVGKENSGRLLDGKLWDESPQPSEVIYGRETAAA